MDYLASPSLTAVNFSIRVTGLAMTDASAIRLSWINGSPLWESRGFEVLTPVYSGKRPLECSRSLQR
jgi:hypothetical protein